MGRHVSVQCYGTSVTWESTSLFSIIPYLRVPIVMCPSHSLFPVYTSKHLYDKNLNKETIRKHKESVLLGNVPTGTFYTRSLF